MTPEQNELRDRLLRGELSPAEVEALRRELAADESLANQFAFDVGLDRAIAHRRTDRIARRQRRRFVRRRWAKRIVIALLVIATSIAADMLFRARTPVPFESDQAYALLEKTVLDGEARFEISRSANTEPDWQDLILNGTEEGETYFYAALNILKLRPDSGECSDPTQDYYVAILALYLERDYQLADRLLDCPGIPRTAAQNLPRILAKIGLEQPEAALHILGDDPELTLADLPPPARRYLEKYISGRPK